MEEDYKDKIKSLFILHKGLKGPCKYLFYLQINDKLNIEVLTSQVLWLVCQVCQR